jgi:hypothetical protein
MTEMTLLQRMNEDAKKEMLVEALEFYITDMIKTNCNEIAVETFTKLKNEIESELQ